MPHEWRSDDNRPKPKEPFFGPGVWWFLFAFVPQIIVVTLLVHYVIQPLMRH